MRSLSIIILCAGKGSRMKSDTPKVLHNIAMRPMLQYLLDLASELVLPKDIYVVVNNKLIHYQKYQDLKSRYKFHEIIQEYGLGTGCAVKAVFNNKVKISDNVLILYGDTPLITIKHIKDMLIKLSLGISLCLLAFYANDAKDYGKILLSKDKIVKIVEYSSTIYDQEKSQIYNSGIILCTAILLKHFLLAKVSEYSNREFFLTDISDFASKNSYSSSFITGDATDLMGINDRTALCKADKIMQKRIHTHLLKNGVSLIQPENSYFAYDITIENDVVIYPFVFIGPSSVIMSGSTIYSFSHIEGGTFEKNNTIGPFARIRPKTIISQGTKVGNFVEIKNSFIGKNSKISHMSYIGDVKMDDICNIGAGVVFCNYNGEVKNTSIVSKGSFIGANSTIISPIKIGEYSTIAAGSTINKNVKRNDLGISRAKQVNLVGKSIVKK